MKRNIYFIALIVCCITYHSQGQWIQTLELRPEMPTTADSIYLIATVQTPNSTCNLNHTEVTIENSVVGVNACYAHGLLTAICQRTDTISLGKIEEVGSYELLFMASLTGFEDTTCTAPQGSMMSSFNFTVDLANPVSAVNPASDFNIYPNPSSGTVDLVFRDTKPFNGFVKWFDQYGREVHRLPIQHLNPSESTRVNLKHLPDGLYYCVLIADDQIKITKRMMIIQ